MIPGAEKPRVCLWKLQCHCADTLVCAADVGTGLCASTAVPLEKSCLCPADALGIGFEFATWHRRSIEVSPCPPARVAGFQVRLILGHGPVHTLQPHLLDNVGPEALFLGVWTSALLVENESQRLERLVDTAIRKQGASPRGRQWPPPGTECGFRTTSQGHRGP